MRKVIHMQQLGVRSRLRAPTFRGLDTVIEDIAADRGDATEALLRFVLGVGYFGLSLPGGSVHPLFDRLSEMTRNTSMAARFDDATIDRTEDIFAKLGLTWDKMIELVNTADEKTVAEAQRTLRGQLAKQRHNLRAVYAAQGVRGASTNLKGRCSIPADVATELLRSLPGKPTRAQLLSIPCAIHLVTFVALRDGATVAGSG